MATAAFEVPNKCQVLPRKLPDGRRMIPPGFRPDHVYDVIAGFFPNGSSDLHYLIVNESGATIPLIHTDVSLLPEPVAPVSLPPKVLKVQRILHSPPKRIWSTTLDDDQLPFSADAFDLEGREMVPHNTKILIDKRQVIMEWSYPIEGYLHIHCHEI